MKTAMMTTEERRIARWERLTADPPRLEGWRRPGPTKALITCYFSALGALTLSLAGAFFWTPAIWFYLAATVVMVVSWTILRSTIDIKDSAPEAVLDEYERRILAIWHRRSQRLFTSLLLLAGFVVMTAGMVFHDHLTVTQMAVSASFAMFLIGLVAGSLPAVGYALTFNTTEKE